MRCMSKSPCLPGADEYIDQLALCLLLAVFKASAVLDTCNPAEDVWSQLALLKSVNRRNPVM
jgi:hypothetical protein